MPKILDYVDVAHDGKRYRVEAVVEDESTPYDADCYSPEDIESWKDGNWDYVTVIVTPLSVPENVRFQLSESLSAVEYDFRFDPPVEIDGRTYYTTGQDYILCVHPVPDLIDAVARNVKAWELKTAIESYGFS